MSRRRGNHGHAGETPSADEVLLTVHQVAENWRVSVRTVRRMTADGRLPIMRLGRAVRIPTRATEL